VVILPLLARVACKRLQIGTDMLLIITSTGGRLFRFINSEFLAIFGCSAHVNTELQQNG